MVPRDLLRRRRTTLGLVVVAVAAGAAGTYLAVRSHDVDSGAAAQPQFARPYVVARVVDGDTLELANGDNVRLVQIDAPELREDECYGRAARAELVRLAPVGSSIRLQADVRAASYPVGKPRDLDKVDRFGRLLAYVFRDGTNVNLELVRAGAAAPWFFNGVRGRYAEALLRAARAARARRAGLWGACPSARLDPLAPVEAAP